jgi:hypothetical protein
MKNAIHWNETRYAEPLGLTRGQGDPLDLASTNERLYNTVFPGFNNVVRYIGVYSAMCWMASGVQEHLESADGLSKVEAEDLQVRAMDKMELALLWASGAEAKLAGKTRTFARGPDVQRLTMEQWDMAARLMSATQYLPSLTNGLKFMDDQWICTDRGRMLAQAFEAKLGSPQAHQWLRDVTCLEAREIQMRRARAALSVLEPPSTLERESFLASFFPDNPRETGEIRDTRDKQRWESLHLVLNALGKLEEGRDANDAQAIRAAMTSGMTPSGRLVIRPGLERSQALWAVLQLRVLQRLALETILAFVIGWVQAHDRAGRRPEDCADEIGELARSSFAEVGLITVADLRARIARAQGGHVSLALAATATGENAGDIFFYMRSLQQLNVASWHAAQGEWLRLAVASLAVCAVETENLRQQPPYAEVLETIAGERTSLTALQSSFERFQDRELSAWVRELVGVWAFSRYEEVASQRAVLQGGKLRFDFTQGDSGLEIGPVRNHPFKAVRQADKLDTALILLQQCELVASGERGWRLTPAGNRRVRQYTADVSR